MNAENTPETIVLIHGLCLTPRSREHWIEHYEERILRACAAYRRRRTEQR